MPRYTHNYARMRIFWNPDVRQKQCKQSLAGHDNFVLHPRARDGTEHITQINLHGLDDRRSVGFDLTLSEDRVVSGNSKVEGKAGILAGP
jgi:hypothetical protein